jgi:hypothetical protein
VINLDLEIDEKEEVVEEEVEEHDGEDDDKEDDGTATHHTQPPTLSILDATPRQDEIIILPTVS